MQQVLSEGFSLKTKPFFHFYLLSILLPILLGACGKSDLPEYWGCKGNTQQVVKSSAGDILETYSGTTKLLLERYQGTITQYVSKPFTGVYKECASNEQTLSFRLGNCNEQAISSHPYSEGQLDKASGKLLMSGKRSTSQGIVNDQGSFQCQFLGNRISAAIFE